MGELVARKWALKHEYLEINVVIVVIGNKCDKTE